MATKGTCLLGLICGVLVLSLLAGCGGGDGGVTGVPLASIEVTPANSSMATGTTRQFVATGIFSDATRADLTASVSWSSADSLIATIDNSAGSGGLVTAVSAGSTTIHASSGNIEGSTALTVTTASLVTIEVTPTAQRIALETVQQFTAIGIFSDKSTQDLTTAVSWSSSVPAVAIISNAAGTNGLATSVAAGSTTITATFGGESGSTTLTVTAATLTAVEVTPTNPSIALGTHRQFNATGIFSDDTRQDLTADATWSSSAATVATISDAGLATGAGAGTSTITASFGGMSGATTLTVTAATLLAIEVTPLNPSLALGVSLQFAATGTYSDNTSQDLTREVNWLSSSPGVVSISNATGSNGLAGSVAVGTTTVTAILGGFQGSTTLTVTSATLIAIDVEPASPSISVGIPQQFIAIATFSDNTVRDITTEATWGSSAPSVATVSNAADSKGLATTLTSGSTTITASLGSVSGNTLLTLTNPTLLAIEVTPPDPTIPNALSQQFIATGIYSDDSVLDLTPLATWSSSANDIATISNEASSTGLATAVNPGTVTITASFGGLSGSTTLSVTQVTLASIAVTPANQSIATGTSQQFVAIGTYSDSSTLEITRLVNWSSTIPAVAVISNADNQKGMATGVSAGLTSITAAFGSIASNSATLTVTSAILQSIAITPAAKTIALDSRQQFTATGNFSDGSTQDLTGLVTWGSADSTVAKISNATSTRGLATSLSVGSTTITATFAGITGETTLTVIVATLESIVVTPADPRLAAGASQQFTATGMFTGAIVQDLTKSVKWSSSNKNAATISNGLGTRGLARTKVAGETTISAKKPNTAITGSTTLMVE
jgi:hypothetical protein